MMGIISLIFLFFFLRQCLGLSASVDVPTQIHIAFAGRNGQNDSNGMAIGWNTKGKTPTSTVQFGVKSGLYARKSMGSSDSYYESFNHHVVLENLRPNTEYFYRVGDETFGWSQEYSFRSAPSVENLRSNFSFYVFGDLGKVNGESSEKYIKANLENIHFVWHAGDMSYADDSETYPGCEHSFCYDKVWDDYLLDTEEWASQIPYMVIPGNHEADCHDSYCATNETLRAHFTNFTAYNHRFRMPSPESGGVLNMWYSCESQGNTQRTTRTVPLAQAQVL